MQQWIKLFNEWTSAQTLLKKWNRYFEGEGEPVSINEEPLKKEEVEALLSRNNLSSLLPYRFYEKESGLFYNTRSISFMLSVIPVIGGTQETIEILHNLFTDVLPDHSDIQFLLVASDKVLPQLDYFKASRSVKGGVYAWLAEKRAEFLAKGIHDGLTPRSQAVIRDFKLYLTVSLPKAGYDRQDLLEIRENVIKTLQSASIHSVNIELSSFLSQFNALISPSSSVSEEQRRWQPQTSLDLQLTDPECVLKVKRGKLIFERENEDIDVRSLVAVDPPSFPDFWKMGDNIGQLFNESLRINTPFAISMTFRILPRSQSLSRFEVKKGRLSSVKDSQLATIFSSLPKEYQDAEYMIERLKEGGKAVKYHYQVVIYSDPAKANQAERRVKDLFSANGWKLKKPWAFQLASWQMMLPMTSAEGLFEEMERMGQIKEMTAFNAVNMLPIQGEWKGSVSPSMCLVGRRGQLAFWNPFDNPQGNYNMCIIAKSGSGKSVFAQEYMVSILSQGGRIWVIDAGRSYEKTCRLLGGTYIEFSKETEIRINPFSSVINIDDSMAMLKPLIASMARIYQPITDEEYAYIEKAIKGVWETHGNQATITHISDWLKAEGGKITKNLALLLHSFTEGGNYGRYFEGESSISLDNDLVVLELDDLKQQKDLQRIVLMVLIYHITQNIYLSDRKQRKNCIMEEIWDMFKGTHSALAGQFIEAGVRTARRFGAGFIGISQSFADFHQNEMTQAMYDNSDFKIILSQEYESIERAKDKKYLHMNGYIEHMLKSLHTINGEYSELAIKGFHGLSMHRLFLDPYSSLLYSSKAEEFQYIRDLEKQGNTLIDALKMAAEKFRHVA